MTRDEWAYVQRWLRDHISIGAILGFAVGYFAASAVWIASFAHYWPVCP